MTTTKGSPKRSKHNIDRTEKGREKRTFNGILFDSELEIKYLKEVLIPGLESGEIDSYRIYPKYILQDKFEKYGRKIAAIYYEADFETIKGHETTVIDIKGMPNDKAPLKRKLFDKRYPELMLEWVSWSKKHGGWLPYDELARLRREEKKNKTGGR